MPCTIRQNFPRGGRGDFVFLHHKLPQKVKMSNFTIVTVQNIYFSRHAAKTEKMRHFSHLYDTTVKRYNAFNFRKIHLHMGSLACIRCPKEKYAL